MIGEGSLLGRGLPARVKKKSLLTNNAAYI